MNWALAEAYFRGRFSMRGDKVTNVQKDPEVKARSLIPRLLIPKITAAERLRFLLSGL